MSLNMSLVAMLKSKHQHILNFKFSSKLEPLLVIHSNEPNQKP